MPSIVSFIRTDCPTLKFQGLMAMGAINDLDGFRTMAGLRDNLVSDELVLEDFVLSMGTSGDYEMAI